MRNQIINVHDSMQQEKIMIQIQKNKMLRVNKKRAAVNASRNKPTHGALVASRTIFIYKVSGLQKARASGLGAFCKPSV